VAMGSSSQIVGMNRSINLRGRHIEGRYIWRRKALRRLRILFSIADFAYHSPDSRITQVLR